LVAAVNKNNKNSMMMDSPSQQDYYNSATMISSPSFQGRSFNKRLDATHLDIVPGDNSFCAIVTRTITGMVGRFLRPRQVIVILRLLKALTFCTLCLTIIANLMFIFFVEISVSTDVSIKLGGLRDRINRLYGIGLAVLAVLVELDMKVVKENLPALMPFLIRSFLLLFVASLSGTSPMISYERKQYRAYMRNNNGYNYNYDDDGGDDDGGDDDNDNNYGGNNMSYLIKDEVPTSAVAFQSITSFILFGCACAYFLLGAMCLDRFTARAFLADDDQVAAAVNATAIRDTRRRGSFDSYENAGRANEGYSKGGAYHAPNAPYTPERSYA